MKILKNKQITLGSHTANQFIIFESKIFFSIILYYFKSAGWQDRFHTHAFNAISIKLFGSYAVRDIVGDTVVEGERKEIIKYFPKATNHMLGPSKGCATLLFSGPWDRSWTETKEGRVRTLLWGRKIATSDEDSQND
ncbi:MAG: hypothetical protein V3U65_19555 [Granulosicoccaceae bacterium]